MIGTFPCPARAPRAPAGAQFNLFPKVFAVSTRPSLAPLSLKDPSSNHVPAVVLTFSSIHVSAAFLHLVDPNQFYVAL